MIPDDSAAAGSVKQWAWLLPATALGLYAGRLLSELLRPGLAGAVTITLIAMLSAALMLRRLPLSKMLPALILLAYVVYPEADPRIAAAVGALSLVTWLLYAIPPTDTVATNWRVQAALLATLAVGSLILYVSTLAPDILPADNGEFQLIATELGVAHPTGFPLYTMLANLITRLPFQATPAYKVNLFSAFTSVATLLLVYLSVWRLTASMLAGVIAAMALGTSTTFWAQATMANIRSMTAMFAAAAIYMLLVLRDRQRSQLADSDASERTIPSNDTALQGRPFALVILFIAALSLGITHHASLVFMGAVFFAVLIYLFPRLLRSPRRWPAVLLAALVSLLPLLYLPLRGAAGAVGAPGDLTTFDGFLNHVLALGFRGDFLYFTEPTLLLERLKVMVNVLTFQFSPLLLLFAGAGLVLLVFNDRLAAVLLGSAFLVHTIISALYRAPQTVEYMLPAYVPAAICIGYAIGYLRRRFSRSDADGLWPKQFVASLLVAVVCLAAIFQFLEHLPSFRQMADSTDARDYAQPLLEQAPPGAVLLADWHWVTPLWYLQVVEGLRPDVEIAYVFPTGEPYGATWARRISEQINANRPVIATHFDEFAYAQLEPPEPFQEAFYFPTNPRRTMPDGFASREPNLENTLEILGYRLESPTVETGQETVLTVAWRPLAGAATTLNLFAHVVDEDGRLVAQDDMPVVAQDEQIALTQFRLTLRPDVVPGKHEVLIGAYGPDIPTDPSGPLRTPLTSVTVEASAWPPPTSNSVYRPLARSNGTERLVGLDWDQTLEGQTRLYLHLKTPGGYRSEVHDVESNVFELPSWYGPWGLVREGTTLEAQDSSYYVPFGQGIAWTGHPLATGTKLTPQDEVESTQNFLSSRPIMRDLVVSVRLVGFEEDGFHWAWWDLDDGVPAMGAIPTLKWIQGSHVRDPRWLAIPDEAWNGQTTGPLLRLYDAFTGRPLPILDERISNEATWIPLGKTTIGE